jgi:hypothetical protein
VDLDVKSELYVMFLVPHTVNRIKPDKFPQSTAVSVWPDTWVSEYSAAIRRIPLVRYCSACHSMFMLADCVPITS